jgi:2-phosphosulfolactate phosphatase
MKIIRKSCAQGAKEAEGLAVIIDVFRAFTCEPLFFHFGVKKVLLEAGPEEARALKRKHPEYVLVGEVNEIPLEEADLGNSPSEIVLRGRAFFQDRVVIHRTTAGVTGVRSAMETAAEVVLGSFLMARAVADYVRARNPEVVTLVAMGDRALKKAPEDEACADYMEHLLTGKPFDPVRSLKEVLFQPTAQKFIRGEKPYLPREDPVFCLQRDLFDFILFVGREGTHLVVTMRTRSAW